MTTLMAPRYRPEKRELYMKTVGSIAASLWVIAYAFGPLQGECLGFENLDSLHRTDDFLFSASSAQGPLVML